MNSITLNGPFDMKNSIESGQPLAFHSQCSESNGTFHARYSTSEGAMSASYNKEAKKLNYSWEGGYTKESARKEVARRFCINDDMQSIYGKISTDDFMTDAISAYKGMRVTCNDPWETTLCFILSQFNNMKRIRNSVRMLANSYGQQLDGTGERLFPSADDISKAGISDLMRHGAGFRAKYIKGAAETCSESLDLQSLYKMDYETAKETLMEINGIGDKVADCILLFAYRKMESFPIDVWVKRVLEKVYFNGKKKPIKELHTFAADRWDGMEGYAQQYLFWHARSMKIK